MSAPRPQARASAVPAEPPRRRPGLWRWSLGAAGLTCLGTLLPWVVWGPWSMPGVAGDGLLALLAALGVAALALWGRRREASASLAGRIVSLLAPVTALGVCLADLGYLLLSAAASVGATTLGTVGVLGHGAGDLASRTLAFPWEAFLFGLTLGRYVPALATAAPDLAGDLEGLVRAADWFVRPGSGLLLSILGALAMLVLSIASALPRDTAKIS
ncbi:MAG TPA: hypothetical protein PK668_20375 [Myxococcota bacterium]|nr:hypothetical protein [Myxococcota bacterium]HRY96186.1 hypothetical protein [Myxococcota bacterium]